MDEFPELPTVCPVCSADVVSLTKTWASHRSSMARRMRYPSKIVVRYECDGEISARFESYAQIANEAGFELIDPSWENRVVAGCKIQMSQAVHK